MVFGLQGRFSVGADLDEEFGIGEEGTGEGDGDGFHFAGDGGRAFDGAGVDIGPRRSRFTCAVSDTNVTELAIFSVTYLTSLAGGDLTVKGTIYNLFNFDTPLRVTEVAQVTNTDGSFSANPEWGVATKLQDNRTVSLVVRYEF